jgi:hypothetical protein
VQKDAQQNPEEPKKIVLPTHTLTGLCMVSVHSTPASRTTRRVLLLLTSHTCGPGKTPGAPGPWWPCAPRGPGCDITSAASPSPVAPWCGRCARLGCRRRGGVPCLPVPVPQSLPTPRLVPHVGRLKLRCWVPLCRSVEHVGPSQNRPFVPCLVLLLCMCGSVPVRASSAEPSVVWSGSLARCSLFPVPSG